MLLDALDANKRGIEDGSGVCVRTKRGEACFWADVSNKVVIGSAEVNAGGGEPIRMEGRRDGNTNVLTEFNDRGPILGVSCVQSSAL